MQNYHHVNQFFSDYIYKPSLNFALFPISWAFPLANDDPSLFKKALFVTFAPLFLESTALTCAIALSIISSAMIIHAIAAVTAGLIDICSEPELNNRRPVFGY
jgi:hypothetical protein